MRKSIKTPAEKEPEVGPAAEENDEEGHRSYQAQGDDEEGRGAHHGQRSEQTSEKSGPEPVIEEEEAEAAEDRLESANLEIGAGPKVKRASGPVEDDEEDLVKQEEGDSVEDGLVETMSHEKSGRLQAKPVDFLMTQPKYLDHHLWDEISG